VNALLHGKRDGKIVIENVKPKSSGGKRRLTSLSDVIDETFEGASR